MPNTWCPINVRRLRVPHWARLEVAGPDGRRYPARLVRRRVVAACGPVSYAVPIYLVPRRPLVQEERQQLNGLRRLLMFAGYGRTEVARVAKSEATVSTSETAGSLFDLAKPRAARPRSPSSPRLEYAALFSLAVMQGD